MNGKNQKILSSGQVARLRFWRRARVPLAATLGIGALVAFSVDQMFNQRAHKSQSKSDIAAGIAAHDDGALKAAGQWVPVSVAGEPNLVAFSGTDAAGCARYQIIGPATRAFDGTGTTAIRCKKDGKDVYSFK